MEERLIRLLIADDHVIVRDGLRRLLETEPDFRVVGEASNGEEAVALTRELDPDILLLDLAMPRLGGLDVIRELAAGGARVRTILLTGTIDRPEVLEAFRLGARGVVLKEQATDILFKSIRMVHAGQLWVGRDYVGELLGEAQAKGKAQVEGDVWSRFHLTRRELDIVAAVVAGSSNREIARKLSLSEQTVKHHLTSIFDKMGVSSRLEMAVFAIHHRVV
jgi:DNA-binding NarL/FixJ family response regulator